MNRFAFCEVCDRSRSFLFFTGFLRKCEKAVAIRLFFSYNAVQAENAAKRRMTTIGRKSGERMPKKDHEKYSTDLCAEGIEGLFFAELYSLDISVSWLVILLVSAVVLSVATPPIPGGGMACYTMLFAQMGIPMEALAIALACHTVFDFLATGFDQFTLQLVLLDQAGRLGLVDREKLLKDRQNTAKRKQ